jgi:hypothetical protein
MSFTVALFLVGCEVESLGSFGCIGVSTSPGATALKRMLDCRIDGIGRSLLLADIAIDQNQAA